MEEKVFIYRVKMSFFAILFAFGQWLLLESFCMAHSIDDFAYISGFYKGCNHNGGFFINDHNGKSDYYCCTELNTRMSRGEISEPEKNARIEIWYYTPTHTRRTSIYYGTKEIVQFKVGATYLIKWTPGRWARNYIYLRILGALFFIGSTVMFFRIKE